MMKFSTPQPRYVVFEGLDGSGTTTQWKMLQDWMQSKSFPVIAVKEPTNGPIGKLIRSYLSGEYAASQEVLAKLFAADRWEQMYKVGGILEHLQKGNWIVSDRCLVSSLAYQSLSIPFREVLSLNKGILLPSIIFYLDIDPQIGMHRVAQRKNDLEIFESVELQIQIRKQYLKSLNYMKKYGVDVVFLSGAHSVESIHEKIKEWVTKIR
jgi:dTMP kinase